MDPQREPMSELEMLRMKANQKTDESLNVTRNMVGIVSETQQTGAATLEQLNAQGDQLRRIDQNMDQIDEGIRDAEGDLYELDKCCGLCVCPWNRRKKAPTARVFNQRPKHSGSRTDHRQHGEVHRVEANQFNRPYISRITNDAREDEMEENLQYVAGGVAELRSQALDMNHEIKKHNEILDRIDRKADANQASLDVVQKHAEQIVGRPEKPKEPSLLPPGVSTLAASYLK